MTRRAILLYGAAAEPGEEVPLMAQFLRSVLYPNSSHQRKQHLQHGASSSSSAPTPHRRFASDSASSGTDNPLQHDGAARYNNPPMFFDQNPEVQEPTPSVRCYLHRFPLQIRSRVPLFLLQTTLLYADC
jgi:hypothetical protein